MRLSYQQYAAIRDRKRDRFARDLAAEHARYAERTLNLLGFCSHCGRDVLEGEHHEQGCRESAA